MSSKELIITKKDDEGIAKLFSQQEEVINELKADFKDIQDRRNALDQKRDNFKKEWWAAVTARLVEIGKMPEYDKEKQSMSANPDLGVIYLEDDDAEEGMLSQIKKALDVD